MISRILTQSATLCFLFLFAFPQGRAEDFKKALNPDLSADALFSFARFNRDQALVFKEGHESKNNGFNFQAIEMTLTSAIDPYLKGQLNLAFSDHGVEVEEAFALTTALPANLQVKAGQFYTPFGLHNGKHAHEWDFVNQPLVYGRAFGGEGLRSAGASVSWLSPLPWYSELTYTLQNSTGETAVSFRPDATDQSKFKEFLHGGRWVNFFDLNDSFSLKLGGSYVNGPNEDTPTATVGRTQIYGGDLYVKYRNPSSLSFLALKTEALRRIYQRNDLPHTQKDWGLVSELTFRLPGEYSRWHLGARYDWVDENPNHATVATSVSMPDGDDSLKRFRVAPVVTYYPSEFSKIRFQYEYDKPRNFAREQTAFYVQFEFLMGAHGAHSF